MQHKLHASSKFKAVITYACYNKYGALANSVETKFLIKSRIHLEVGSLALAKILRIGFAVLL